MLHPRSQPPQLSDTASTVVSPSMFTAGATQATRRSPQRPDTVSNPHHLINLPLVQRADLRHASANHHFQVTRLHVRRQTHKHLSAYTQIVVITANLLQPLHPLLLASPFSLLRHCPLRAWSVGWGVLSRFTHTPQNNVRTMWKDDCLLVGLLLLFVCLAFEGFFCLFVSCFRLLLCFVLFVCFVLFFCFLGFLFCFWFFVCFFCFVFFFGGGGGLLLKVPATC